MEEKMINRNISQLIVTLAFFYSALICHFKAIELFEESNKLETNIKDEDINPSRIFIERAYEFKRYPPRKGWRGAFILVNK